MADNKKDLTNLPMMALEEIPEPNQDANQIVGLQKENGRVTGYLMKDGQILGKEEAVQVAKQGGIQGVGIAIRNGNEYLKSLPDEREDNNLSNLPSITK